MTRELEHLVEKELQQFLSQAKPALEGLETALSNAKAAEQAALAQAEATRNEAIDQAESILGDAREDAAKLAGKSAKEYEAAATEARTASARAEEMADTFDEYVAAWKNHAESVISTMVRATELGETVDEIRINAEKARAEWAELKQWRDETTTVVESLLSEQTGRMEHVAHELKELGQASADQAGQINGLKNSRTALYLLVLVSLGANAWLVSQW